MTDANRKPEHPSWWKYSKGNTHTPDGWGFAIEGIPFAKRDAEGRIYITCYCLPSEREARLAEALRFLDRMEGKG